MAYYSYLFLYYGPNVAASLIGPPITIETGLVVPVKEPVPLPVQPVNVCPVPGFAVIETLAPLFFQPLAGVTVPPVPALIVRKYWIVKLAV